MISKKLEVLDICSKGGITLKKFQREVTFSLNCQNSQEINGLRIQEILLYYVYVDILLRSTKWNANLILLRDYAELVSLCKVIVWKTHIPVRTQK